jgi:dGTP triphosphohydrolase
MHKSKASKISYLENLTKQFNLIFENSLRDLEEENFHAPIFIDHIEYIDDENYSTYFEPNKQNGNLKLIARDFIAGMSDQYFSEIFSLYNTD